MVLLKNSRNRHVRRFGDPFEEGRRQIEIPGVWPHLQAWDECDIRVYRPESRAHCAMRNCAARNFFERDCRGPSGRAEYVCGLLQGRPAAAHSAPRARRAARPFTARYARTSIAEPAPIQSSGACQWPDEETLTVGIANSRGRTVALTAASRSEASHVAAPRARAGHARAEDIWIDRN